MNVSLVDKNEQSSGHIEIRIIPDECPKCHHKMNPRVWMAFESNEGYEVVCRCPKHSCKAVFIAYYAGNVYQTDYLRSEPITYEEITFSDIISNISPGFTLIYNQSLVAESQRLTEIVGAGLRKALEFLVKDYVIKSNPEEKDKIEKEFLGVVIESRVKNPNVKAAAKRAAWLGNDEIHYVRKWTDKDVADMKRMIELTINWIELEELTGQALAEMPDSSVEHNQDLSNTV